VTLAVWSDPIDVQSSKLMRPQAKLGGTALALLAYSRTEQIIPNSFPKQALGSMGEFLCFMQQPDGQFHSKYYELRDKGWFDPWVSLYYPGEAILALLALHEVDPNPKWLTTAARGLSYLAEERKLITVLPVDHWALIATSKLQPHFKESGLTDVQQKEILNHACRIARQILASQLLDPKQPKLYGGYSAEGATCPTATRLEGLLALSTILSEENKDLRQAILVSAEKGIGFLLDCQISEGRLEGGIPRNSIARPDEEPDSPFNRRVGEVRIDYVQHAMSAFIHYENILLK